MKDEKLYELLNQMTLEEKIGQLIQVAGEVFLMNNTDIVTGPLKELELSEQMLYNVGSILNIVGTEKVRFRAGHNVGLNVVVEQSQNLRAAKDKDGSDGGGQDKDSQHQLLGSLTGFA